ncbi:MAG: patatin-like phospholipase family protein [Bdellovibrionota bacterium]
MRKVTYNGRVSRIQLSEKKNIALVCGGGGVKAACFHTGVAMALERLGFAFKGGLKKDQKEDPHDNRPTISTYVGSSAGSFISTYLAQGGRIQDFVGAYRNKTRKDGDLPPIRYRDIFRPRIDKALNMLNLDALLLASFTKKSFQSPFSTEGLRRYMLNHVLKTDHFSELAANLYIVATDVNEPRKVIFGNKKSFNSAQMVEYIDNVAISDACAASMALPPLFHPYRIQVDRGVRDFFDGEIREPLSDHIPQEVGCDLAICSYISQPLWQRKETGSFADLGVQSIALQALMQVLDKKIRSVRGTRRKERILLKDIRKFFKEKNIDSRLCDELCGRLAERFEYDTGIDYIYIHPLPSDSQMFHLPNFSLNEGDSEMIIRKGYRAAMLALARINPQAETALLV